MKNNKNKVFIGIIVLLFLFIGIGFFTQNKFSTNIIGEKSFLSNFIPKFQTAGAGYFDFSRKKIPANAKYIDFTFSKDLEENTIIDKNIDIYPKIKGKISLINRNVIRFTYDEKLENKKNYIFTLSKDIKSDDGKSIGDTSFEIETVSEAKVVKVSPTGGLQNLDQNFIVFFNVPMVPLTDLDSRDKLPCPISFKPEVKGKCKWTTTSVLEFIPEISLAGSTNYEIFIKNKKGLNYPLGKETRERLTTPKLNFYVNKNFSVKSGISFSSNFEVSLDEVKEKVFLYKADDIILSKKSKISKISKPSVNKLNINITKNGNRFNIKLKNGNFNYNTAYKLKFSGKINSVNGNIPYQNEYPKIVKSYDLLSNINVYKNIYSKTGALVDTESIYINNNSESSKYIPIKNLFFDLSFEEEVGLDKKNFDFVSDSGEKIDFKIEYIKEEKDGGNSLLTEGFSPLKKSKINKKKIRLTLNQKLKNNKIYKIIISKNINKYLKQDIIKKYYSSKKLELIDFRIINYKKTCLYLTNDIKDFWNKSDKIFETFPKSKKIRISDYDDIDYKLKKEADKIKDYRERKEFLLKKGYCTDPKNGESLFVLKTRLNPNTKYELKIKNDFEDKYGNKLEKTYSKKITTGDIDEEDKYLYCSVSKDINVIPNNLPIVINLQTYNLNKVNLEVCEMDEIGYIDYIYKRGRKSFKPKCLETKSGDLDVVNRFWNVSNNRFDLEEDFLERKFKYNFILVSGSKINGKSSFENIYIRENISVALENAKNKKLLFITDFKGNILEDVLFRFYKYNYKTKKADTVKIKTIFNKKTKVFEILASEKNAFDFIIVKQRTNSNNIGFLNINSDVLSNYGFNYISGNSSSQKKYLYLYTERPIYKQGDTVFVKGLLREFKPTGYAKTDIKKGKLKLIDPNGTSILEQEITVGKNSNFDTKFVIPKNVSLGKFRFQFQEIQGKNTYIVANNAFFDIEEYRKPTFKVNIDSLSTEGFNPLNGNYTIGDTLKLKVKPEYYFGGKMTNTSGNYSILTQNYIFDAKDYSEYQFGEGYSYFNCIYWGACSYKDSLIKSGEFSINEKGEYEFDYKFVGKDLKGEKLYNFTFEVTDPDTKRVVSKTVSKVLHNTDAYVGLKSRYYNTKDAGLNVDAIVLDFDSKPLAGKKVKIIITKKEWKSVKKKGVDGIFYNDYALKETIESKIDAVSDKKGEIHKNIKTKSSGEYEIKFVYTGKNKKEFISSMDVYVAGNDYVEWHNSNNDITEFVAEKIQVKVGDRAEYILKSPINSGKALIVIEKDDAILDYFIHDIKSYSDKIFVDVKNTYYPNYYIKAFLIGNQKNNPLPVYKRALIVTKVNTEYKKLNVSIKTDKKNYLPGAQVALEIKVTDYKGNVVQNTDLSISLVDESLLALKGNPKKNPYAFFYDLKRYLGISTYASLKNLIEKLEVKGTKNGEKGGAGESVKGGDSKKKRGNFKDTAFWQANISTDKNGVAKIITKKLPDNLTTWVIEVLANTANDTKIGINYETIVTSKKLLISDNLPRVFGSNDTVILSPVVFNKTGKTQDIIVDLKITNADIIGNKIQKVNIPNGESKTVNFKVKIKDIGISEDKNLFNSKINFKASSADGKDIDELEKFLQIKEVSTQEAVSTFGKTNKTSFEEKINVGKIKNSAGKLTINYSATLLTSILDGIKYLSNYPYGCSEQKTSAIMPNIFIKQLYNSVGKDFDLTKKMVKYWVSDIVGYQEKSLDQIIKEYLVNIKKYQKNDGGFVYFYDITNGPNYSNFELTSYILESGANISKIGYKLDEKVYNNSIKYLKTRFYKNYREGCSISKYNNCKYSETSRLKAISAILDYNENDYEAYKMYKLIDFSNLGSSSKLEKAKVIAKLLKINDISKTEKQILEKQAKKIIDKIISEDLVFNPRGAFIGNSGYYGRFRNTVSLLEVISIIGLDKFSDIEKIIDNMNRWIIGQKKNGSFGSTFDNIALIKAVTKYLESSGELKNVSNTTKLKLNNKIIVEKEFSDKNKLEFFSKIISLDNIKDKNSFIVEKDGKGTIYYDLNLSYYKEASNIKARDEGFFVEVKYYNYNEYKKIESLKNNEWKKYMENKISYEELKYPKNIFDYLTEVKTGKVGDLLIVRNKIITTETRDKVSFEGFIPAGAELINPKLATSTKKSVNGGNIYFSKKEYRKDRLFAYKNTFYPGIYNFTYLIRLTHSGEYSIKPTKISEFYNIEVFGRNKGKIFKIEK